LKSSQEYDITLKSLISEAGEEVLDYLAGTGKVKAWLNVELPQVRNPRVDLLARLESGGLFHVELQSTNDMTPQRMLEYAVGIWRNEGVFPDQLLLYVGNDPLRIVNHFRAEKGALDHKFAMIDIRSLDGDAMLKSQSISVNILSILAGSKDRTQAIRKVIMRIARLQPLKRADALRKLLILAGARSLAAKVGEESRNMPVTSFNIMDNEVLGPAIRKGIEQGIEQGIQQGLRKGLQKGETKILRIMLEKRFGRLPVWVKERLKKCTVQEAEDLALRVLDARNLEDLFS
jgi:hypothetical protein